MILHLTRFVFVAVVWAAPATATSAVHTIDADSTTETLITAEQLNNYIAVRKALGLYWKAPENAELFKSAQATKHFRIITIKQEPANIWAFNYSDLVKRDTALAAIFTRNHFRPEQLLATKITVLKILIALGPIDTEKQLPSNSTVLGKNLRLVKAHYQELAEIEPPALMTDLAHSNDTSSGKSSSKSP